MASLLIMCVCVTKDNWDVDANPMTRIKDNVFEIVIKPTALGKPAITHNSKVKVSSGENCWGRVRNCWDETELYRLDYNDRAWHRRTHLSTTCMDPTGDTRSYSELNLRCYFLESRALLHL